MVLGAWAATGLLGAAAAAAPAKPEATRKSFDYRRPNPGEMLPNPASGIGTPPQLKEFAPTGTMGETPGAAAVAEPGQPLPPEPISAPALPAPEPPAPKPAADTPAATAAAPAAASPTRQPASPRPVPLRPPSLQAALAAEIGRVGIDGVTTTPPAGALSSDLATERAWTTLADGLATSRAVWERRFPDRTPAADVRVDAVAGPGRLTVIAAPGRLTGAFDDPPP